MRVRMKGAANSEGRAVKSASLYAPVAQLDRALASEARGREFEPHQAHQIFLPFVFGRSRGYPSFRLELSFQSRSINITFPVSAASSTGQCSTI